MGASSLDYTIVYVPRTVDITAVETPQWLCLQRFPDERDVNPLAWLVKERNGVVLDLRVPVGFLSKRRTPSGVIDTRDPEQRHAALAVINDLMEATPNRWVLYAYWTGFDEELRRIEEVGQSEEEVLEAAESDVLYRFRSRR